MNMPQELRLRTAKLSLKEIALVMGYPVRQTGRAANRIHRVITSETLGLDAGGYDYRYSDTEFVLELCKVLDLDLEECTKQVEVISSRLFEARMAYIPWLSVMTEPNPATLTIQVFGFPQGVRQIMLPQLAQVLLHQQIREVKPIIIQHYQNNDGRLSLWGSIQRYRYFYHENESITFDIDGHVVEAGEDSVQPPAKITINGKDLSPIIQA